VQIVVDVKAVVVGKALEQRSRVEAGYRINAAGYDYAASPTRLAELVVQLSNCFSSRQIIGKVQAFTIQHGRVPFVNVDGGLRPEPPFASARPLK
jgi:hypothetical protein